MESPVALGALRAAVGGAAALRAAAAEYPPHASDLEIGSLSTRTEKEREDDDDDEDDDRVADGDAGADANATPRGPVSDAEVATAAALQLRRVITALLKQGCTPSESARRAAESVGVRKKLAYEVALELSGAKKTGAGGGVTNRQ